MPDQLTTVIKQPVFLLTRLKKFLPVIKKKSLLIIKKQKRKKEVEKKKITRWSLEPKLKPLHGFN